MESFQYMNNDFVNSNELLYRVNRAGSNEVDLDFSIERNSSYPYCVIHYVKNGSGQLTYRGKKYSLKKGQCFILNSFESHRYCSDTRNTFELNWMEFNGGDSAKLVGVFLNCNLPIMNEALSEITNKYMLRIFTYLNISSKNRDILISKAIYSILMKLLAECGNISYNSLPDLKINDVKKVMNHIDCNLGENLSMEQISKVINYNPQYFTKLFQRYIGVTLAKYVLDRRISKAKELLSTEEIQIDLIAEQLGFCNASHFIRKFKKAEGLTPAEFRKESMAYYDCSPKKS